MHPELPEQSKRLGREAYSSPAGITQKIKGERYQAIGQILGGTAIASVAGNVTIQQSLPQFLSKHQLSPDIADFTGRTKEINEVLTALRRTKS